MQAHSSLLIADSKKGNISFRLCAIFSVVAGLFALERSAPQAKRSSNNSQRALRIVIAGGGTGGHLFPGIAIAREFEVRNSATRIIFVSTGNPMERSVLSKTLRDGEYGTS